MKYTKLSVAVAIILSMSGSLVMAGNSPSKSKPVSVEKADKPAHKRASSFERETDATAAAKLADVVETTREDQDSATAILAKELAKAPIDPDFVEIDLGK